MAERRFTKLKASLSGQNAAKTRENVSRELRQSLKSNNESIVHCIDTNYESILRDLEKDFDFVSYPKNDIKCESIANKTQVFDFPKDLSKINSLFSRECISHYLSKTHLVSFNYEKQYFGSVFELKSGSSFDLKPHIFECDETDSQTITIREGNCFVNGVKGWLTITKTFNENCFLSFFNDNKKDKLFWTQEVNERIVKENDKSFKFDDYLIEVNETNQWVNDLNNNLIKVFDAKQELNRILNVTQNDIRKFEKENKINLFSTYSELNARKGVFWRLKEVQNYDLNYEKNVFKFVLSVEKLELNLHSNDKNKPIESYFAKISLFDTKSGKISEEFRFDFISSSSGRQSRDSSRGFDELSSVSNATKAVFSIDLTQNQRQDLFLVLRIEKSSHRVTQNTAHFEPFVWSARPVFKTDSKQLDLNSNFSPFYKQDINRLSDEFITTAISNQNLLRNNTITAGKLLINISEFKPDKSSSIHSIQSLELISKPNTQFINLLYVYPQSLKYDSQKVFSKARNISVKVELKDDDSENSKSFDCIFSRPNDKSKPFVNCAVSAISKHNLCPDFYEEIKINLPLNLLNEKLHLLFTFEHISCKKECNRTIVGYSWLPLNKQIHCQNRFYSLSVFASLPNGYLSCQSLGLGKGLSMPEIKFIGKDLFKVSLKLVSTVLSRDPNIQITMNCVTRITSSSRDDSREISKLISMERNLAKQLKTLVSSESRDHNELIRFSQTILLSLFRLIVFSLNNDLIVSTLQTIIELTNVLDEELLYQFIDQTFIYCECGDILFHEQLIKSMNKLLEISTKSEDESRLILKQIWFMLRIQIKAMVQYLFKTQKLDELRENRFSQEFNEQLKQFIQSFSGLIVSNSRLEESQRANRSLSHFITRLTSFMDRSFVFNLFYYYINVFSSRDIVLNELKLNSIAIFTAHEHHINHNQPLMNDSFSLSIDFCEKHFPIFVLLNEFSNSLNQNVRHVRQISLQILRNLLAKHSFDDRYNQSMDVQKRVISLYLPALQIIIENLNRIMDSSSHQIINDCNSNQIIQSHVRHNSLPIRFDKFNSDEINDIIVCCVYILGHLTEQQLNQLSIKQIKDLFSSLELSLYCFEYKPRKCLEMRSKTLPTSALNENNDFKTFMQTAVFQQNFSIQISLISLQTINLYFNRENIPLDESISKQILSLYLTLLTLPQSQTLLIHIFENLRFFVLNFSQLFFSFDTFLVQIISKIIQFCNSSLTPIRDNAIDLLYSLFGANFKRIRFETIVCVSRLASSDSRDLTHFQFSSLNRIEKLANSDPNYGLSDEMKQVVVRIREILKATQQIREESRNYYEICDLMLELSNSYAQTSRSLRRTWLENLSEVHAKNNDWTERAICLCHVIKILIEQLKIHKQIDGLSPVFKLSDNISQDIDINYLNNESDWLEIEESHITIDKLENVINDCVLAFEKAELFELAPNVLKVLVNYYEKNFDHKKLVFIFTQMAKMHSRALETNNSGKRLFSTYFRVAFFGSQTKEYIYKESKAVSLAEMSSKMEKLYPKAIFLTDSSDISGIDTTKLYLLITHVMPFMENAKNDFERNTFIKQFVFEQRLKGVAEVQSVAQQYKKRVILTIEKSFPYCLRRIEVKTREEKILSPIEVAIDEMQERVHQLERVTQMNDAKHLQLILQGSVHVTVNCGPISYANAFLTQEDNNENEMHLRQLFEQFLELCEKALKLNEKLIKNNQIEYHLNLKTNFEKLKNELNLNKDKRTSVQIFDVISGTSIA